MVPVLPHLSATLWGWQFFLGGQELNIHPCKGHQAETLGLGLNFNMHPFGDKR